MNELLSKLVMTLLAVPGLDDYDTRTSFLTAIPKYQNLNRNRRNDQQDMTQIALQLDNLRLVSGGWALVTFIDSALANAEGFTVGEELKVLRNEYLHSKQGGSVGAATQAQSMPSSGERTLQRQQHLLQQDQQIVSRQGQQHTTQDSNISSKKDFFISYNKADRRWAEWIAWQLEENGYTTFLQAWDFAPGSNFAVEMDKAAKDTERTIAVLSPNYLTSLYTLPEWANAFAEDPTGNKRKLVPICVRQCEIKGLLAAVVYIDLIGQNLSSARERLLEGVRAGRHKPKAEPVFPGVELTQPAPASLEDALRLLQGEPPFPKDLPPTTKAIEVFYSYASEDKDLLVNMEKQMALLKRLGLIIDWHDDKIRAGQETNREIEKHFSSAQIILLLVSANFLASEACYDIAKRAMEKHKAGMAEVIPIIIKPVDWRGAPFDKLDVLPKNKKPITSWPNREEAFLEVSQGIRDVVEEMQAKPS